jgi:hypothetical protein
MASLDGPPESDAWVAINDSVDRQRDFGGDLYGQCGPEDGNRWSWCLLRYTDGDPEYVAWGRVGGPNAEAGAKAATEQAAEHARRGAGATG